MPNIELYGLNHQQAKEVMRQIQIVLKENEHASGYVMTHITSSVVNNQNKNQPFIRLVTTYNINVANIVEDIKKLKMDIEVLILDDFFSRPS